MTKFGKMLKINSLFLTLLSACFCFVFAACTDGGGNNGGDSGEGENPPVVTPEEKVAKNNDYSNPIYPLHNGEKTPVYTADPDVYVSADNIHPSKKGYEVYLKLLKEVVEF